VERQIQGLLKGKRPVRECLISLASSWEERLEQWLAGATDDPVSAPGLL